MHIVAHSANIKKRIFEALKKERKKEINGLKMVYCKIRQKNKDRIQRKPIGNET